MKYEWATTAPHPTKRAHRTGMDQGQIGWRLHLISMPSDDETPSLCGLTPRHGWALDMFIDATCARCVSKATKLKVNIPKVPKK